MSIVGRLPLPPGAVRRDVEVRGGPLAVVDVAGSGPPVVLVPGFTGSKEDFRLVLEPLSVAGRRVVAVDQRGQFESPGPEDESAYAVEALAQDLLALLDALGDGPAHLVGHSFGGLVCRAAALARPDAVRSVTLMSSGPQALTGPRVELLPLLRPVLEQGGTTALADAVEAMGAADPRTRALSPQVRAFLRDRLIASTPAALTGMADALVSEPDRVDALRATGLPLLVLHGDADDAWAPALQEQMAQRLGARHVVVQGAVHSPAVEAPAATASALATFFADVERAG
jgi:pimeloyl-ACP methyl ester carboxylesterase